MKIVITGYRGFIGQHMVAALKGHDLTLIEPGDQRPLLRGYDWVIHLGAISSTTERDVELILERNLEDSIWWLKECQDYGVNFQFASSAGIYGNERETGSMFAETDAPNPKTPYAWSKYLFERHVRKHVDLERPSRFKVQGFRYFNVYGGGEEHKGNQASPFTQFRHQAKHTGEIRVFEHSDWYHRDFVPVEQVVDTHLKFFDVDQNGIFNVGTGTARSFQDVANQVARETGAKIRTIPMPERLKAGYQAWTCADTTKTNEALATVTKP